MNFIKYFLIWLCVLLMFGLVAGYVYVRMEGKHLFEHQLGKFFGQPTEIEDIRYLVPLGVRFTNLKIQNVLEAEDVRLHLRIPLLLDQYFVIARLELTRPVFHFVLHDKKKVDFGGVYLKRQENKFQPDKQKRAHRVLRGFDIDFLTVTGGRLEMLDLSSKEPVKYEAASLNGKAMNLVYPLENQQVKFDVQGKLVNGGDRGFFTGSQFTVTGWVNWPARSMEGTLDILTRKGVTAKMNLSGEDNLVKVVGHLDMDPESAGVVPQQGEAPKKGADQIVSGLLQAFQSKLALNFSFKTKMDAFAVGTVSFEGNSILSQQKRELKDILNPAVLLGVAPAKSDQGQ